MVEPRSLVELAWQTRDGLDYGWGRQREKETRSDRQAQLLE
jgi:hypothetical protein